ncbi:MAG: FapA family protein [Pseudodesulfovibrio sp.]
MPTTGDEGLCPLPASAIDPIGDLNFPVIPNAIIATINADALPPAYQGKEVAFDKANLIVGGSDFTLVATTVGKLKLSEKGLRVEPLWSVSDDRMTMTMTFFPKNCFGKVISDDKYREYLPEGSRGVDNDVLDAAVAQAQETQAAVTDVEIAHGLQPSPGKPGEIRLLFDKGSDVGQQQEDGSINFRERGGTACVEEGEEIARLIPPTKGRAGFDVMGNDIPGEDGKPAVLKAGKDVRTREEEGGVVVYTAGAAGMVLYKDNTLAISELLEINSDIDLSSGNVHVEKGSILIKGTVTTGAKVTAKENVVVEVVVENATIKAGGDITVGGGVLMEEGGIIEAGGTVTAKFMRNATIRAGGDVVLGMDCVNCDIVCGGSIIAGSDKGILNGGTYVCGGMDVAEMGSSLGTRTYITLALPQSEDADIETRTRKIKEKINELEKFIGTGNIKDTLLLAPKEDRSILVELFKIKALLLRKMIGLNEQKEMALAAQGQELSKRRLKARRTANAGVTITIGDRSITLNKPEQASKFHWNAEKIGIAISGI